MRESCIKESTIVFHLFQPGRRTSPLAIACVWLLLLPAVLRPVHTCGGVRLNLANQTAAVSTSASPVCTACIFETSTIMTAIVLVFGVSVPSRTNFGPVRNRRLASWSGSLQFLRPPPSV